MTSATSAEMPPAVGRHDESMHIRNVTFKIEDCVFRVPIQMFEESKTFYDMVERATSQDPDARHSIPLEGIGKDDFRCFLRFMYQRQLGGDSEAERNAAAYTFLLKVSTKWRFKTIRAAVICGFPDIPLVDKIILARDCCVKEWLVDSLNKYVRLGESITLQDVESLGMDYILKIAQIRDNMERGFSMTNKCRTDAQTRISYDFQPSLTSLFQEEIDQSRFEPSPVESWVEDFNLVDIYFLVEDHLFKSYRQCFEISPVFRGMFSLPVGTDNMPDGYDEHQPLQLEGITQTDFASFVYLINPRDSGDTNFSLAQWTSVLKLSTMWDFIGLRQYAMREILKLNISLARQISLARDYRIQEWLLPTLDEYTRQEQPITAEDVDLLGWLYVLKILQARGSRRLDRPFTESAIINGSCLQVAYKTVIDARTVCNFTEAIKVTFQDEISRMELQSMEDMFESHRARIMAL